MSIASELQRIAKKNKGILRPYDVVEFASANPKSELHSKFEWDDKKAGHAYRLWQARKLIVTVQIEMPDNCEPVQMFVSLDRDRSGEGGGYRSTAAVLKNDTMRSELLAQCLRDAAIFKAKYKHLTEAAKVIAAIDSMREEAA